MKLINIKLWIIVMVILTAITLSSLVMAQEIRVGAGAAGTEDIFNKISKPFEKASGIKLILISNGPVEALQELDKGSLDVAVGGISFPEWMEMMEKENYIIADRNAYKHRVIGKDIIKVIVHKENTVRALSREQLKNIFTGKTINWKDVGGKDMPITVVWGSKIPGTNAVFMKQIMDNEAFTKNIQKSTTAAEIKILLTSLAGGVGLGPASIIDETISAPEIPEVIRPITAVTKNAPSLKVLKLFDFILGEGRKYLRK